MSAPGADATAAWHEFLDGLRDLDQTFLTGPKAVDDDRGVSDGYRTLATAAGIALDTYLFADPSRPMLIDLVTPTRRDRRWGGDNTDCWYSFAPIDPARTYRVTGTRGDSAYFCFTVYNEPEPGAFSTRIDVNLNDTDLTIDGDGRFEFTMGPRRPDGHDGVFVELAPDARIAFTRDYQVEPATGCRTTWAIESLDPPEPLPRTSAATATALRAGLRWIQTLFGIVPLHLGPADPDTQLGHNSPVVLNEFAEPYRVENATYGWSAFDATYSFATFTLRPDEALVVTHRPPDCRFWNLVTWNAFMATEGLADGRTSINHGQAVPNADGTVTIVVGHDLVDHPNAVSTAGRTHGALAFRWFLADTLPDAPTLRVVAVTDLPPGPPRPTMS